MEFEYKIEDIVSSECYQVFRFRGIDKKHESKLMIELPLVVISTNRKDALFKVYVYVIDADVTFLVGKKTLKNWGSILNTRRNVLETEIDGVQKNYRMVPMRSLWCA